MDRKYLKERYDEFNTKSINYEASSYFVFNSFILWPKFNEPNPINCLVKHVTELEKPKIVNRYFSINL